MDKQSSAAEDERASLLASTIDIAIRDATASGRTQTAIAVEVKVSQPTVSRWAKGQLVPSVLEMWRLEQALRPGEGTGWLLAQAKLVEVEGTCTVEESLAIDGRLDESAREILLAAYLSAVQYSDRRRSGGGV